MNVFKRAPALLLAILFAVPGLAQTIGPAPGGSGTVDLTTGVTGVLPGANGGTGVANTGKTITLGGNLATTGAFNATIALSASVTATWPGTSFTAARTDAGQTFTGTNVFGVLQGTSLALGGATIGTDVLAGTGSATFSSTITGSALAASANGAAGTPAIGRGTSGFYYSGSGGDQYVTIGGTYRMGMIAGATTPALQLATARTLGWESSGAGSAADLFMGRNGAAIIRHGDADVTTGAVAQTITFQGNTASTTNGPLALIRGAGGGSSTSVGGELRLSGGLSSAAAGTGGAVTGYAAPAAAGNVAVLGFTLTASNSFILGNAALATNANDGFLYVASGAGTPTGTPTTATGRVAMYLDTTNSQLWFYLGGAWKQPKTPAGAALVTWQ